MGKDRAIFDASSSDCHRVFKFFVANFRDFFEMEDYINPAKPFNSKDYPKLWPLFVALSLKRNGMFSLPLSTHKSPRRTNIIQHNASPSSLNSILAGSQ